MFLSKLENIHQRPTTDPGETPFVERCLNQYRAESSTSEWKSLYEMGVHVSAVSFAWDFTASLKTGLLEKRDAEVSKTVRWDWRLEVEGM